jgi:hypothetical protein
MQANRGCNECFPFFLRSTLQGDELMLFEEQFAAEVRELKKPEPYKGKGIKYSDETILRKAGKVVKVVGGGK